MELIGNTPMIEMPQLGYPHNATIFGKLESFNPMASVKDRIGKAMIDAAEDLGPVGEDNAYGYGLVDAERMIENLPKPIINKYVVDEVNIINGAELAPGSLVDLQLVVRNEAGIPANVYGRMVNSSGNGVELTVARVPFVGDPNGTEIFSRYQYYYLLSQ